MSLDVVEILKEPRMVKVCAPMVRYSKLQFRTLVKKYDCDICFTPMIIADSFVQSAKARESEFSTSNEDRPLIVQFAAKTATDFLSASEMVAPYCNGVDLNCGCPQRWAMHEGYGADLLKKPHLVQDLVKQVRNRIPGPFTVSVKIRLLKDVQQSVELCRVLEKAGASFVSVHARTVEMRNEPILLDKLKLIRQSVQLPLIANGDVKNFESAEYLYKESGCDAIMSARGILTNPALFSGYAVTPVSCIQDWLDITSIVPTSFLGFHHHLVFMLEKLLPKKSRLLFNNLQNRETVFDFLEEHFNVRPSVDSSFAPPTPCIFKVLRDKLNSPNLNDNDVGDDTDHFSGSFLRNIFTEAYV